MSLKNGCALVGAALGFYVTPVAAQTVQTTPVTPPSGDAGLGVSASTAADAGLGVSASTSGDAPVDVATPRTVKGVNPRGLEAANTMDGPTGLLRTISADSGATGTFRFSLLGSYYTGSGFLCPTCSLPNGHVISPPVKDDVSQIGTRIQISATPIDFLEAFAALRFQSTSDNQGDPKAIEIVGDLNLGLKAFMPAKPDRILSFGGGANVLMLNSPGGVGLSTASVGLVALGTADFTRQTNPVPLRIHLNVGYLFDDSGNLADDVESERAKILGNKPRITRIERFGHDINRVDSFRPALGVEGVFPWVRPFAEWTLDIPVNRQGYDCGNVTNRSAGDRCLSHAGFSAVPSRLTLGARVYPWAADWMQGLSLLAAVDIGTGATGTFIEEVAPELPWAIHVGLGYAADVSPRGEAKIVEKIVEKPAPVVVERYIAGAVTLAGKGEPIPNAIVRYVGRAFTGMVTDDQGVFQTMHLDPGEYRFAVTADGFKDGECSGTIPDEQKPVSGTTEPPAAPVRGTAAAEPVVVHVACELEALPKTATITGTLRDAETTDFIEGATVTITDPLGRQLALKTDAEGTFRFGNVPAGKSKISVEADKYLSSALELTLEPRKDVSTSVSLYKKPAVPNVVVTKTEIKLKKEVHFLTGSAEILPDSMELLEEAADAIRTHAEIASIEIQGHTDDTGTPDGNLRLSADRANAVRDVFVANGVDPNRLTTHGYGQEKPLVPNTTPKNRARNRRVQLLIVQ